MVEFLVCLQLSHLSMVIGKQKLWTVDRKTVDPKTCQQKENKSYLLH
jgi:hypothetical protein